MQTKERSNLYETYTDVHQKDFQMQEVQQMERDRTQHKKCYYAYLEEMLPKNVQRHGFTSQKHKG
jgi:hypothetical protein